MKKFTLWKKRTPNKKNQHGKYTYFFVKKNQFQNDEMKVN